MEFLAIIGAVVLFLVIVGVALWQTGLLKITTEWNEQ